MFGFDPLSWAIGYAASEGVDWARANIGGGLDSALASAAEEWADDLPNEYYIEEHRSLLKTLLSPPTPQEQQAEELSNRRQLAITLGDSEIPSEEQWLAALLERWEEVRRATSGELQAFFTISEEEAENHLRDLSERFVQICLEEPKRFRRTVFGRLNDLEERVEGLSHSRSDPNSAGRRSGLGWRLVHPYPLLPGFSGRERERRELSHWLNGQNAPLYLLFAQGGFGKSALAWYWLHHDVEQEKWPQVIWWSF